MNPASRQMIMEALKEAMSKEELHTRGAAQDLNLNPCYVSMALNPKSWDSMGKAPWIRLAEWFNTREPLGSFQIPDGEEIWKPRERDPAARITEPKTPKKVKKEKRSDELKETVKHKGRLMTQQELEDMLEKQNIKDHGPEWDAPFRAKPLATEQHFTDTARLKIALDIEINLVINGHKISL